MTLSAQDTNKIRKKGVGKDNIYSTSTIDANNSEEIINLGFASNNVALQCDGDLNFDIQHSLNGVSFEIDAANQNKTSASIVSLVTNQNHPVTSIKIVRNSGSGKVVIAAV